jgi:hypothetical protein
VATCPRLSVTGRLRQGTGAVVLAAVYAATRVTGIPMKHQTMVVFGAGAAGVAIADQVHDAIVADGATNEQTAIGSGSGLSERLRVGGHYLLDRLASERAQPHHRPARRRGPGHRHLPVGMDRLHAGRRDDHRQRHRLPHYCR